MLSLKHAACHVYSGSIILVLLFLQTLKYPITKSSDRHDTALPALLQMPSPINLLLFEVGYGPVVLTMQMTLYFFDFSFLLDFYIHEDQPSCVFSSYNPLSPANGLNQH